VPSTYFDLGWYGTNQQSSVGVEVQDFGKTAKASLRAASPKAWSEDGDALINSTLLLFSWLAA